MTPLPQIAVIADPHVHFPQADFGGAGIDVGGQRLCLRSWDDTRAADRVFNESLAAFRACLDAIRSRGIRDVVLLGDLTDDGQRANVASMAALLAEQTDLRFFALPGNHDCFAVAGKHVTTAFLSDQGAQTVTSDPEAGPDALITDAMRCDGIVAGLALYAAHGFTRQPTHLHWESPFGPSEDFAARRYAAISPDGSVRHVLTDASYLVEPVPGLWLLMLDANVFAPRNGITDPRRKRAFGDPARAGWPALLDHKPHLRGWIRDVATRARAADKRLLTFSHYPALSHFDPDEAGFLTSPPDPCRAPGRGVAQTLAGLGIDRLYTGHLHLLSARHGEGLHDVSVPSPASFPGGFLVIDTKGNHRHIPVDAPADPAMQAIYPAPNLAAHLELQLRARARRLTQWPEPARSFLRDARLADLGATGHFADQSALTLVEDWHILRKGGRLGPDRLQLFQTIAHPLPDDQTPQATQLRRFLALTARAIGRN